MEKFNLHNFYPKSGQEFAGSIHDLSWAPNSVVIFSADMESAYDNVLLPDILEAVNFLSDLVNLNPDKVVKIKEITTFLFQNSYLKSSFGIFKLQECIPQGGTSSGDLLELVCLPGEILAFSHLSSSSTPQIPPFLQTSSFPSLQSKTICYRRFRDDTFFIVYSTDCFKILEIIKEIKGLFPSNIRLTFVFSFVATSFLNVMVFKHPLKKLITCVKRNFKKQIPSYKLKSNLPSHIDRNPFFSRLADIVRICNATVLEELNKNMLSIELEKLGLSKTSVMNKIKETESAWKTKCKRKRKVAHSKFLYAGITFEKHDNLSQAENEIFKKIYAKLTGQRKNLVFKTQRKIRSTLVNRVDYYKATKNFLKLF